MTARDNLIQLMGGLQRSDCCNICACGNYDRRSLDCAECSSETVAAIDALAAEVRSAQREKDAQAAEAEGLYDMANKIRDSAI